MAMVQRDWIQEIEDGKMITSMEMQAYVNRLGTQREFTARELAAALGFAAVSSVYALVDADHRPGDIAALIGQRVAVTGIYSHVSGLRRQLRYAIRIANPDDIRVLDVRTDPFDVPDVRETDLFRARDGQLAVRRKATGRVLTVWGGHNLLLRTDGGDLVRGELAEPRLPSRGDRIVLAGLQETDLYSAILTRAI